MRIALLGYRSNPFSGGQGVYLRYLSRALRDAGHQVDVISGEPYPHLDDGIALVKLPGLNLYAVDNPLAALRPHHLRSATAVFEWASMISGGFPEPATFGRRVRQWLNSSDAPRYDVIHDNQTLSWGTLALQRAGLPLITTIHHPITRDRDIALAHCETPGLRLLIRRWHAFLGMQIRVARRLNRIVTVSHSARDDIASEFGVDPARISVVHNGVDTETFRPMEVRRDAQRIICTASADQPLKGLQHLLPAFAQLREARPDVRLTIIGTPKAGGATEQTIARLKLSECVEFRHGLSTDALVEAYASARLAVVPSEYEGFGLPAAEAMACGLPVVAAAGGGLPEVVGDAGLIVPVADPQALCSAMQRIFDDPALEARLRRAGRARMQAQFGWQDTATAMLDLYARVA